MKTALQIDTGSFALRGARRIVHRTNRREHGPITRLVSRSNVGALIKHFVFLDGGQVEYTGKPLFGIHPHSGIATLSVVLGGGMAYEDTTGKKVLPQVRRALRGPGLA
jgi:redox-sensitive bicupin YhaK (pirin superfamily)